MISKPITSQVPEDDKQSGTQANIELSGTVLNQTTQEAEAGVDVYLSKGDTTTTDNEGQFSFMLKPGTYRVTVDGPGYENWSTEVTLDQEDHKAEDLTVELVPSLKNVE